MSNKRACKFYLSVSLWFEKKIDKKKLLMHRSISFHRIGNNGEIIAKFFSLYDEFLEIVIGIKRIEGGDKLWVWKNEMFHKKVFN